MMKPVMKDKACLAEKGFTMTIKAWRFTGEINDDSHVIHWLYISPDWYYESGNGWGKGSEPIENFLNAKLNSFHELSLEETRELMNRLPLFVRSLIF